MARNRGILNFSSNLEGNLRGPIDAKQRVGSYSDLIDPCTWTNSGNEWTYVGMIVSVASSDASAGIYVLNATDYTNYANWIKSGTGSTDSSLIEYYIKSASLGTTLYWNASTFDVSDYVSKTYVDSSLSSLNSSLGNYVLKTGDTMTGSLIINASLRTTDNAYIGGSALSVGSTGTAGSIALNRALDGTPLFTLAATTDSEYTMSQGGGLGSKIVMGYEGILFKTENASAPYTITTKLAVAHGNTAKVGIGINPPVYNLDVSGNFHTTGSLTIDGSLNINNQTIYNVAYPVNPSDGVPKIYVDASFALKTDINSSLGNYVLKAGDIMTGNLTVPSLISISDVSFYRNLDVSGSITSHSNTTGQSTIQWGLIVNADASGSSISDFVVKTDNYDAIDVSAGNDAIMIMNSSLGKIGFFGTTPTIQNYGWDANNGTGLKTIDVSNMTLNQLSNLVSTLINELITKGLIGG